MTATPQSDCPPSPSKKQATTDQDGRLLGLLCAIFFVLFTLLPDSHSLMVAWPWVLVWQLALTCPILWLCWQLWFNPHFPSLGHGLDLIAGVATVGLVVSSQWAEFPQQARWYGWAALGVLAAFYALNAWCYSPERRYRLFVAQGILHLVFIVVSLSLWTSQTLLPELARLRSLQAQGLTLAFNFSTLELRNWAPMGHQNYVAGYLLLALPVLCGLSCHHKGLWRGGWLSALGLGLLDLYSTSSRGGWLGIIVAGLVAGLVLLTTRRGAWQGLILVVGSGLSMVLVLLAANNRLRSQLLNLFQGNLGGETAYRLITNATGWKMGNVKPWAGLGPGSVPLTYQHYHPAWAGTEAEHLYQLHGTLAQLWAELGLWGVVAWMLLVVWLSYQGWGWLQRNPMQMPAADAAEPMMIASLYGGFLAYGVISLTDYQLDNLGISGLLVINLALVSATFRQRLPPSIVSARVLEAKVGRGVAGVGVGLMIAMGIWLVPIHQAWSLSRQGFAELAQEQVVSFQQRLSQAHAQAPWEPYYAYQLGWNLGNLGLQASDPTHQQELFQDAITYFQQGLSLSPHQEFGHSNLGWLRLRTEPETAASSFVRSAHLLPAKQGVFFGLGLSLLAQDQSQLALEAMTLECLRYPLWITSPIWGTPQFQALYPQLLIQIAAKYDQLLAAHSNSDAFAVELHRARGVFRWWQGNLEAARQDLDRYGTPLHQALLALSSPNSHQPESAPYLPAPAQLTLDAWSKPQQRRQLLSQAWLTATQTPAPSDLLQSLSQGMQRAETFEQWLQQYPTVGRHRHTRAGFGVISRHIDGPAPVDFFVVVDNVAITTLLQPLPPTSTYHPQLDQALQGWRDALLDQIGLTSVGHD